MELTQIQYIIFAGLTLHLKSAFAIPLNQIAYTVTGESIHVQILASAEGKILNTTYV